MSKTYAFWRNTHGKPHRQEERKDSAPDDGKYAPRALLAKLGTTATLPPEGGISWPWSSEHHELELALRALVVVTDGNEEAAADDSGHMVWTALVNSIKNSGGQKAVHPNDFLKHLNDLAAKYFREPTQPYHLLTSLSVAEFSSVQISESSLSTLTEESKYDPPDALTKRLGIDSPFLFAIPTAYLKVVISTSGRSISAAADKALDAINLVRGIWTLIGSYGSKTISLSTRKERPIGIIHLGPLHTIHTPDGKPATELYWYDPDFCGEQKLFVPKGGWNKLNDGATHLLGKIKELPYRSEIENIIRRFVGALDHCNLDVAFLQLWNVLERVTDTIGGNYDETIRRASWIYGDRELVKELLGSLRVIRNQYVHASQSAEYRDQVAYMAKSLIEPHLLRLIYNDLQVSTIREYAEILSFPPTEELRKRRRDYAKAIRFLTPKRAAKPPASDPPSQGH